MFHSVTVRGVDVECCISDDKKTLRIVAKCLDGREVAIKRNAPMLEIEYADVGADAGVIKRRSNGRSHRAGGKKRAVLGSVWGNIGGSSARVEGPGRESVVQLDGTTARSTPPTIDVSCSAPQKVSCNGADIKRPALPPILIEVPWAGTIKELVTAGRGSLQFTSAFAIGEVFVAMAGEASRVVFKRTPTCADRVVRRVELFASGAASIQCHDDEAFDVQSAHVETSGIADVTVPLCVTKRCELDVNGCSRVLNVCLQHGAQLVGLVLGRTQVQLESSDWPNVSNRLSVSPEARVMMGLCAAAT